MEWGVVCDFILKIWYWFKGRISIFKNRDVRKTLIDYQIASEK